MEVTGFVLTKLDGDAEGEAALSIQAVTGRPIKFAATGEKLADFDAFHPDRLAGRILGMGDVLTLIERAEERDRPRTGREDGARLGRPPSPSRTSSTRLSRSRRWARSARSSACSRA